MSVFMRRNGPEHNEIFTTAITAGGTYLLINRTNILTGACRHDPVRSNCRIALSVRQPEARRSLRKELSP